MNFDLASKPVTKNRLVSVRWVEWYRVYDLKLSFETSLSHFDEGSFWVNVDAISSSVNAPISYLVAGVLLSVEMVSAAWVALDASSREVSRNFVIVMSFLRLF